MLGMAYRGKYVECNENRLAFLFTFFRQHLIDAKSLSIFKCDSCVIRLLYSIYVRVHNMVGRRGWLADGTVLVCVKCEV